MTYEQISDAIDSIIDNDIKVNGELTTMLLDFADKKEKEGLTKKEERKMDLLLLFFQKKMDKEEIAEEEEEEEDIEDYHFYYEGINKILI